MRITYPSLLVLALTVASCGGGGGSDTPTSTAGQAGTTGTSGSTTGQSGGTTGSNASAAPTGTSATGSAAPSTGASAGTSTGTGTSTSGGTGSTVPPAAPAVPAANGLIEYYGDSTVYGYLTNSESQGGPPQRVSTPAPETFAQNIDRSRFSVANKGVNGTSACDLLNGVNMPLPWSDQMASSTARYVIINHGINDLIKGNTTARYQTCLQDLARIARSNGKTVIFETPNPIVPEGLVNYVAVMRSVANANTIPVIDQYAYLTGVLNGANASQIVPDGLHPTQAVYTMKGRFAADEFKKFFP